MKRTFLSAVLALALIAASAAPSGAGSAIPESLATLVLTGLVRGYPDGSLGADRPLNRAELATLAVRASDLEDFARLLRNVSPYPDVPACHWAAPAILVSTRMGLLSPLSEDRFDPDGRVSVAEGAAVLVNVLGYSHVVSATEIGIMDPDLDSDALLTRGLFADMLYRAVFLTETPEGDYLADRVPLYGEPVALKVSIDRPAVIANLHSEVLVTVTAVDAIGRRVWDYDGRVDLHPSPGRSVLDSPLYHRSIRGQSGFLVSGGPGAASTVTLTAWAEGLEPGSAELRFEDQRPAQIALVPDRPGMSADGESWVGVDVKVLDLDGVAMTGGRWTVDLTLTGRGSWADGHAGGTRSVTVRPPHPSTVRVRSSPAPGTVSLVARMGDLETATLDLPTFSPQAPTAVVFDEPPPGSLHGDGSSVGLTARLVDEGGNIVTATRYQREVGVTVDMRGVDVPASAASTRGQVVVTAVPRAVGTARFGLWGHGLVGDSVELSFVPGPAAAFALDLPSTEGAPPGWAVWVPESFLLEGGIVDAAGNPVASGGEEHRVTWALPPGTGVIVSSDSATDHSGRAAAHVRIAGGVTWQFAPEVSVWDPWDMPLPVWPIPDLELADTLPDRLTLRVDVDGEAGVNRAETGDTLAVLATVTAGGSPVEGAGVMLEAEPERAVGGDPRRYVETDHEGQALASYDAEAAGICVIWGNTAALDPHRAVAGLVIRPGPGRTVDWSPEPTRLSISEGPVRVSLRILDEAANPVPAPPGGLDLTVRVTRDGQADVQLRATPAGVSHGPDNPLDLRVPEGAYEAALYLIPARESDGSGDRVRLDVDVPADMDAPDTVHIRVLP